MRNKDSISFSSYRDEAELAFAYIDDSSSYNYSASASRSSDETIGSNKLREISVPSKTKGENYGENDHQGTIYKSNKRPLDCIFFIDWCSFIGRTIYLGVMVAILLTLRNLNVAFRDLNNNVPSPCECPVFPSSSSSSECHAGEDSSADLQRLRDVIQNMASDISYLKEKSSSAPAYMEEGSMGDGSIRYFNGIPYWSSLAVGGDYGQTFNDMVDGAKISGNLGKITKIIVHSTSNAVDSVETFYENSDGSYRHGSKGWGEEHVFELGEDEHITEIRGQAGAVMIYQIQFVLNSGRISPKYGNGDHSPPAGTRYVSKFKLRKSGRAVISFFGRTSWAGGKRNVLNQFGAIFVSDLTQ